MTLRVLMSLKRICHEQEMSWRYSRLAGYASIKCKGGHSKKATEQVPVIFHFSPVKNCSFESVQWFISSQTTLLKLSCLLSSLHKVWVSKENSQMAEALLCFVLTQPRQQLADSDWSSDAFVIIKGYSSITANMIELTKTSSYRQKPVPTDAHHQHPVLN